MASHFLRQLALPLDFSRLPASVRSEAPEYDDYN